MNDIKSRLKYILHSHYDGNSSEMARSLNVTHTTINNYIEKGRILRTDFVQAICSDIGISPNWLILGVGEQYLKNEELKKAPTYFNLGTGRDATQIIHHNGGVEDTAYLKLKIQALEEKVGMLENEKKVLVEFNDFLKKSVK